MFVSSGATWTAAQKLVPASSAAEQQFGAALAVSGKAIVVGARYGTDTLTEQGMLRIVDVIS